MKYKEERGYGKILLEIEIVEKLEKNIKALSEKYKLNFDEVSKIIKERNNFLNMPAEIFNLDISPLENVVMYLTVEFNLSQKEISNILNRDATTIWTTLNNALAKISKSNYQRMVKKLNKQIIIPIDIFSNRKLSVLESLCIYLHESCKFSFADVSHIIGRDPRTIWTVINRGRKKL